MDRAPRTRRWSFPTKLSLLPSEYFHRQVFATYVDDAVAIHNLDLIGVGNLMWSSDYPHNASSWPHSQDVVERDFKNADPEVRRKVLRDNVMGVYNLSDSPAGQQAA
jgi:predicted TIM-barrel fold metal-dependent hydrolase